MEKTPQELHRERDQRIMDAVQLKKPDRVPVSIMLSYFPAKITGLTPYDAYYNFDKWKEAVIKAVKYLEPDMLRVTPYQSGKVLEALGPRQMAWPGHGVSKNWSHQYNELENMKADEYDLFLNDTTDFMIRYYLPRTYEALGPLAQLPCLNSSFGGIPINSLTSPEFTQLFNILTKVGHLLKERNEQEDILIEELSELGYNSRINMVGRGSSPFDVISDFLRGMHGAMLDMYRQPDKLLEAIKIISHRRLKDIEALPQIQEFSFAFMALHRGADGFMSLKQFETFYWPYLLKSIKALVDKGYTPYIFFEGNYTSRLEHLLELPKGKVACLFDCSDMKRVKEVLGGHICISGNVPPSLLTVNTSQDVKDYCKWLIDVVGKDGGYIMAAGSSIDTAQPENLKAMVDFTKEYGRYS